MQITYSWITSCFPRSSASFRLSLVLVVGLLARATPAAAQHLPEGFDETFALASLDAHLTAGADAVVRLDVQRFAIDHPGRATLKARRAVTILGPDGRDEAELVVPYDERLRPLKKLNGFIRDAHGKVVRKLDKADQEDYSAISGYSLYEDSRVRLARLYHDVYPYTVEFEYEVRYDGLINWPTWYPQQAGLPVAYAGFEIEAPAGVEVRYQVAGSLPEGAPLEPVITQHGKHRVLRWAVEALPALHEEPHGPSLEEQAPVVHTAPAVFEIEGARGEMRSWQAFGRWYHELSQGRDALPPDALAEVQRRISGASDDREKVRRLYAYLQEQTRYVNISLGLGGWQPFDAAYVHQRGYGDCKALTNYMVALLKAAGVASYPALIRSGGNAPDVLADFPSNQFDHVVLQVPLQTDTLWLENTSQTVPFGHLGAFTEDRYALVVKPEGGELVRTPRSRAADNRQVRHATVRLDATGEATAEVLTRYTGNQQDRVRRALAQRTGRERTQWLHEHVDLPSFEVLRADFSSLERRQPAVELPLALKIPRYASRIGTRLFLPLAFMDRWAYMPPAVERRTQPVQLFPYAFADVDTIHYALPEGFRVEALPEPVDVQASFGRYRAEVVPEPEGGLVFRRRFEITEPTLPAEQYEALRAFLGRVSLADRSQVVLVQR